MNEADLLNRKPRIHIIAVIQEIQFLIKTTIVLKTENWTLCQSFDIMYNIQLQ